MAIAKRLQPLLIGLTIYFTLFCGIHGQLLRAQDPDLGPIIHSLEVDSTCGVCATGFHLEGSPYDLSFKKEWPFILGSMGILATGIMANEYIAVEPLNEQELADLDKDDIFFIDRPFADAYAPSAAKASDFVRSSITVLPLFLLSNHSTRKDIGPLVAMSVEVVAVTFGLTQLTKNLVGRPRPFTYNEDVDLEIRTKDDNRLSFFSGHASYTAALSFFFAKVMTDYHPYAKKGFKRTLWISAAVIPAIAATLRVASGRHFPTDALTGYAVGAAVGYFVPHLHKVREPKNIAFTPLFYGDGMGFSLNISLNRKNALKRKFRLGVTNDKLHQDMGINAR